MMAELEYRWNYLYIQVLNSLLKQNPNSQKLKPLCTQNAILRAVWVPGTSIKDVEKRLGVQNVQRPRPHTHALEIRRRICVRARDIFVRLRDICKPRAATWTYHFHSKLSKTTMKVPSLLTTTLYIVRAVIGGSQKIGSL